MLAGLASVVVLSGRRTAALEQKLTLIICLVDVLHSEFLNVVVIQLDDCLSDGDGSAKSITASPCAAVFAHFNVRGIGSVPEGIISLAPSR